MGFHLSVYLAACVAANPGTAITSCPTVYQEDFATQMGCAAKAADIIKDKSKKVLCTETKP